MLARLFPGDESRIEARIKSGLRELPSRKHTQTARHSGRIVAALIYTTRWDSDGCEALLYTIIRDYSCKDMQEESKRSDSLCP